MSTRYRAYGENAKEMPWSEVTAIDPNLVEYVLRDLPPGEQFEIQVCTIQGDRTDIRLKPISEFYLWLEPGYLATYLAGYRVSHQIFVLNPGI